MWKSWVEKFTQFSDDQRCQRLHACQDLTKCVENCMQRQRKMLLNVDTLQDGDYKTATQTQQSQQQLQPQNMQVDEALDLEDTVAGLRMMKYFHWRESEPIQQAPELNSNEDSMPSWTTPASSSSSSSTSSGSSIVDEPSSSSSSSSSSNNAVLPSTSKGTMTTTTTTTSFNSSENSTSIMVPDPPPTCAREVHAQWACRAVALACSYHLIRLRACFDEVGKEAILSVPYFGYQEGAMSVATAHAEDSNVKSNTDAAPSKKSIPCRQWQESLGACVAERAAELEQRVTQRKVPEMKQEEENQDEANEKF